MRTKPIVLTTFAVRRFWLRVRRGPGCWEWAGKLTPKGYGQMSRCDRSVYAHRFSYALHFGEPGPSLVCHSCDNPRCVRPDHLHLGTNASNMQESRARGRSPAAQHGPIDRPRLRRREREAEHDAAVDQILAKTRKSLDAR